MDRHRKAVHETEEDELSAPETPPAAEQADGSPRSPSADEAAPEAPTAESPAANTPPAQAPRAEELGGGQASPGEGRTSNAMAELQQALEAEHDKYLRLAAEFDNFRKRAVRERQEAGWRAQGDLLRDMLESLDDLMRFAHVDPTSTEAPTVVQGVMMVQKKLLKVLAGHGLEVIDPVDRPFDPVFHEAVSTEPALSPEDDHLVAKVYQPGYVFRGQLLRPARVVVKQWLG
ncbi:MAG TPA: nucleotide exchange factor GrpE [Gemmatimonadaceae bacterium]